MCTFIISLSFCAEPNTDSTSTLVVYIRASFEDNVISVVDTVYRLAIFESRVS